MSITMHELRNDTYYFVRKEIKTIFLISILATLISVLINMLMKPDINIITIMNSKKFNSNAIFDIINNMSAYEKKELFKYSICKILEFLISKTFLLGSIITFIMHLSNQEKKIICSLSFLLRFFPSLFILNFVTTFVIQIGFIFFIFPGIVFSILFALSPIILSSNKYGVIDSIRKSASIALRYMHIIGTGVLCWMCIKFLFTTFMSNIHLIGKDFISLMININLNILFCTLVVYLFRFYMLFRSLKNEIF